MARGGVNKVILIGNLGADPELRRIPNSGMAVVELSIATNESRRNPQTGAYDDYTEWHKVTLYDKLAEVAHNYLRKGKKVYIEGRLRTDKWKDQQTGVDRYATKIIANDMQMLDSKGDSQEPSYPVHGGENSGYNPSSGFSGYSPPPQRYPAAEPPPSKAPTSDTQGDLNDDIPF